MSYNVKIGPVLIILGFIDLLFGILPGLIVFLITFVAKSVSAEEILPALDRFESVASDLAAPQSPTVTSAQGPSSEAMDRLKNLEILLKDRLITGAEYDHKREEIIASIRIRPITMSLPGTSSENLRSFAFDLQAGSNPKGS